MSAAISVQQQNSTTTTTTTSIYFECGGGSGGGGVSVVGGGDIFNANKLIEKPHNPLKRVNVSSIQDITSFGIENEDNAMELKEKFEQQHMENEQYRFHSALTRTISQPQPQVQDSSVASLVTTLIENLGNMNLHRKLERTQSEPLPQQVNTSRYKTELCRPFEEAGECKYGEKCQFAHGYHELRNLQRHPKYKTEYCRTFHSVGFCPYGPRCHFVHNQDEARALQQQLQAQQKLQQQQQQQQQNHSNNNNNNLIPSQYALMPPNNKQGSNQNINHSLPLSPPLSMSTGSDRESPTGSISLSPTSSMTSFPFGEQISPANSVFQTAFPYTVNTPPESPNAVHMSPVNTPPPSLILGCSAQSLSQQQIYKPVVTIQAAGIVSKQILKKSSSSPIAIIRNVSKTSAPLTPTKVTSNSVSSLNGGGGGGGGGNVEDARLPVFNRLSSAVEKFPNVAL